MTEVSRDRNRITRSQLFKTCLSCNQVQTKVIVKTHISFCREVPREVGTNSGVFIPPRTESFRIFGFSSPRRVLV